MLRVSFLSAARRDFSPPCRNSHRTRHCARLPMLKRRRLQLRQAEPVHAGIHLAGDAAEQALPQRRIQQAAFRVREQKARPWRHWDGGSAGCHRRTHPKTTSGCRRAADCPQDTRVRGRHGCGDNQRGTKNPATWICQPHYGRGTRPRPRAGLRPSSGVERVDMKKTSTHRSFSRSRHRLSASSGNRASFPHP